eukprot:6198444-Pleurochrysis_carterae.AAC.1
MNATGGFIRIGDFVTEEDRPFFEHASELAKQEDRLVMQISGKRNMPVLAYNPDSLIHIQQPGSTYSLRSVDISPGDFA